MITMDGLLAFWIVSALALGQQAIQAGRLQWSYWLLSATACGLGLLTKGPVAVALVAVPLLAYQVLDQRTARPGGWSWPAYLATAIGLASPWVVVMAWRHPGFLRDFSGPTMW
jgi:4-amino-4-deoxy-L-arabinose transferase-like glycosyltransferase